MQLQYSAISSCILAAHQKEKKKKNLSQQA